MDLEIRGHQIELDTSLRERIDRHVRLTLGRHGPRLRRVSVTVEDVNGPKGGPDKRCRITVGLVRSGDLVAEHADADALVAVSVAAGRADRSIARTLARSRFH